VNLGSKADGFIPVGELNGDPTVSPADIVKIGEEVSVFVVRVNDVEGTIMLSMKKIESIKGRKILEGALDSGEILSGVVTEAVNGGLIVLSNGSRVFVPASQASVRYVKDLESFVGEDVSFRIIDINLRRGKIVGSIKSVAAEVRKKQLDAFWDTAEVGKAYTGTVKSLTDFGAFVVIGGVDGLIHISELSWGRIKHPSEVVSVGDSVDVTLLAIDREKNKISLGYRNPAENPWEIVKEKVHVGDVLPGKIVRMVSFGAFAEIIPHAEGLIHISQIADRRIDKVSSVLSIGQEVEAKVTAIDFDSQKISLSIRALTEPDPIESEPIAETLVAEEPVVEEPVVGESVAEEPVVEETVAEEPVAEEPIVEEPVVEEPIVEEPVAEEPIVEEPVVEEPIAEETEE
jgi:4-hydroxy-3-methylbut-2-enyl diphosphate reductase